VNLANSAQAADFIAELDQNTSISGTLPDPSDVTRDAVVYASEGTTAHGKLTLSSNGNYTYVADLGLVAKTDLILPSAIKTEIKIPMQAFL